MNLFLSVSSSNGIQEAGGRFLSTCLQDLSNLESLDIRYYLNALVKNCVVEILETGCSLGERRKWKHFLAKENPKRIMQRADTLSKCKFQRLVIHYAEMTSGCYTFGTKISCFMMNSSDLDPCAGRTKLAIASRFSTCS
jgi:hypothetical protein